MEDLTKKFEAVVLNGYDHEGKKKWNRIFIGNLIPDQEGDGYNLYIPEGISVQGRLRIQPKQDLSGPSKG